MPLTKLKFAVGVVKDESPLNAEGYYIDADKMRAWKGEPQTIGGWEDASTASFLGICRGLFTWADTSRNRYAAIGTHLRLYVMDADGNQYDITPAISRGELTNPFTTTDTDATVSVAHTAHGLVDGQAVSFPGQTAVNGADISGGPYAVTVTNANAYTFEADSEATSSGSGVGGTVDYEYHLAPGQVDGLSGLGYGTGAYGTGGYGSSSSNLDLFPRTWCLFNWGQNLIANPRGGGLYEWAPNIAASELVTNGSFTGAATGWTLGSGWAYSSNAIAATTASADAEQNITLPRGAWCLLDFDATRSAGTVTPYQGSTAIGAAISASGTYKRAFFTGAGGTVALKFTGAGFSGTIDNVSVKVLTTAYPIDGAPTPVTCSFVTAERTVVALGCNNTAGNFDPMRVRWSDQENNQEWTADPSNYAGSWTLTHGTRIVRGLPGYGENLIFTDTAVYAMRYTGDPSSVYRFDLIGEFCGLIGPNAVTSVNGVFFWMSNNGEFYRYAGGAPVPLKGTVSRDVDDNLAKVQGDKVYAFPVGKFSEVWWLYPDGRDGNECSRYVIYSFTDNVWMQGTFDRTAWCDAGVFPFPLATDSEGQVYFQEKGFSENGGPRSWSITSSFIDIGDGDSHISILGAQPDADDLQGGYTLTITTKHKDVRGEFTRTFGPFNVTNDNRAIPIRAVGQQIQIKWTGNDAPTFFRKGAFRLNVRPNGRRR